eukprot:snap_masked-scaffold613_size124221-processed-gene-0.1 protein:Tk11739 transcript:snap_masked-scaffold613_size124221-processed-gene-0.1-mRNA-1 annotation:"abc transporter abcc1"
MDDPLSAVDPHVADHIFDRVISTKNGILQDKTRILVTNCVAILDRVDLILVMANGQISERGTYEELLAKEQDFARLIREYSQIGQVQSKEQPEDLAWDDETHTKTDAGRLIHDEEAMVGRVRWSVYVDYMKIIGLFPSTIILALFVIAQSLQVSGTAWMSHWADLNADSTNHEPYFYLGIFGAIGMCSTGIAFGRQYVLFHACAKASRSLHHTLLYHIMRTPMAFFERTPIGRILNRFSADLDAADGKVPQEITDFVWCLMEMMSILLIIACLLTWFIPVALVLFTIFYLIIVYYIQTSRQLTRLESISKSPLLSHFSESLQGVSSLRVFRCQERFVDTCYNRLDENTTCHYLNACCVLWLKQWTESLGSLVIFSSSLLVVLARGSLSAGLAGLILTYSFELLSTFSWMVQMACNLESNTVSLERIMEYNDVDQEDGWVKTPCAKPVLSDPKVPAIEFQGYSTRYRPGLDLCLKSLDLKVHSGERLGVCGRTGAGKSSLTKALFRILEPVDGRILLNGQDVSELGLHDLRNQITVIPQDPTLFTGTLRFNLDPIGLHSDSELWLALERAHLGSYISALEQGLECTVQQNGGNFSVGQRQLICLARALLRNAQILILDEATAAVDLETDALIQKTIREDFHHCTVLTIAHRLNTIVDSDRILVLEDGRVAEIDSPQKLQANPNSMFSSMITSLP